MSSKRYNLVIPKPLYDELKGIADGRDMSVLELLKEYVRIGLLKDKADSYERDYDE